MAVRDSSGKLFPVSFVARRLGVVPATVNTWLDSRWAEPTHVVHGTKWAVFDMPSIEELEKRYAAVKAAEAHARSLRRRRPMEPQP